MTNDKTLPLRKPCTRERVLDAAERLLVQGNAAFSMRDLATEAELSFATPFNQFGNKGAIMLALSKRRIDLMQEQLVRDLPLGTVAARVLATVDVAVSVMLQTPVVNRVVMGTIGAPSEKPGNVSSQSGALWAEALGDGRGLMDTTRDLALSSLPNQLAVAFRGALSFWTAGEYDDYTLRLRSRTAAAVMLLGFVDVEERKKLLAILAG